MGMRVGISSSLASLIITCVLFKDEDDVDDDEEGLARTEEGLARTEEGLDDTEYEVDKDLDNDEEVDRDDDTLGEKISKFELGNEDLNGVNAEDLDAIGECVLSNKSFDVAVC
jgi:hypothetical protein